MSIEKGRRVAGRVEETRETEISRISMERLREREGEMQDDTEPLFFLFQFSFLAPLSLPPPPPLDSLPPVVFLQIDQADE
jgi:hypothetical protein